MNPAARHPPCSGVTPLHRVCALPESRSARLNAKHEKLVKLLIKYHGNVEWTSPAGVTPLIAAARVGNIAIVESLLDAGADINARGVSGESAIIDAASLQRFKVSVHVHAFSPTGSASHDAHVFCLTML